VNVVNPGALTGATGANRDFAGRQFPSNNDPLCATRGSHLRPYRPAIARIATSACRRMLVASPTGSGKTVSRPRPDRKDGRQQAARAVPLPQARADQENQHEALRGSASIPELSKWDFQPTGWAGVLNPPTRGTA
jgi:hypothetical protein